MVIAVGCSVLQMWRPWALQVRILRAPVVAGHAAVPDPLDKVPVCALRRSEGCVEVPDPSRGQVRDPGCVCCASLLEGHVASPDPFLSRRRVRGHTCDEVEFGRPELAE